MKVNEREVVVFAIRDTYYALDRKCYRESENTQTYRHPNTCSRCFFLIN